MSREGDPNEIQLQLSLRVRLLTRNEAIALQTVSPLKAELAVNTYSDKLSRSRSIGPADRPRPLDPSHYWDQFTAIANNNICYNLNCSRTARQEFEKKTLHGGDTVSESVRNVMEAQKNSFSTMLIMCTISVT